MKIMNWIFACLLLILSGNKSICQTFDEQLELIYAKEFSDDAPGGSILIKKGDKVVFLNSYGLADLGTGEKIYENTIFNTGSISKTFVSNAILILQERGSLSLDNRLSTYFDDFDNPALAEKITIKHMLSHCSGLPDNRAVSDNYHFYLTAKDRENFEPLKRAKSLVFEPGQRFQYSNPAYNGLALIVEQITEMPWQRFVEENIFEPAGMKNSKITNGPYPESGVAHGYIRENGAYIEYDYGEVPTFAAAGNGGIWCSVLDLAKYEKAIQNHIFLSEKMIDESRIAYQPENWSSSTPPTIGYSWFTGESQLVGSQDQFDVDFVYHTGSQGGFRAFHITIPEKDILFVGLFNRPLSDFRKLILDSINLIEQNNWLEND